MNKKRTSGKKPSPRFAGNQKLVNAPAQQVREALESAYYEFNRKEFLRTDPVRCLHRYSEPKDQEVVGLLASAFAYGSAKVFCPRLDKLFALLGAHPYQSIRGSSLEALLPELPSYRFFRSEDVMQMLKSLRAFFDLHSSLGDFFEKTWQKDLLFGLAQLREALYRASPPSAPSYGMKYWLPSPSQGSAKRLHLFMRWMVRKDDIDLGIWNFVERKNLLIPLDTHLHSISRRFKFTTRKTADLRAVLEITEALKVFDPEDPIRFDFALCRIGMLQRKV